MENYYKLLGINAKASRDDIRKAYYKKLKQYHPDLYEGDKSFAEEMTSKLNEAYKVLRDDELKKEHDKLYGNYKEKPQKQTSSTQTTMDYYYSAVNSANQANLKDKKKEKVKKVKKEKVKKEKPKKPKTKSVFQSIKEETQDAWYRYFGKKDKEKEKEKKEARKQELSKKAEKPLDGLTLAIYLLTGLLIIFIFIFLMVR